MEGSSSVNPRSDSKVGSPVHWVFLSVLFIFFLKNSVGFWVLGDEGEAEW